MRPEIEELLPLAGIQASSGDIQQIARESTHDFTTAFDDLLKLDCSIPGLGQHNVNERDSDGQLTGVYCIEDRPIFRGIQYVGMHLQIPNPEWSTRSIVWDSYLHLENSLKRKTGIQNLPMGKILSHIGRNGPLSPDLYDALKLFSRKVYNKAKHIIDDTDMDTHMFSLDDAIAVYLISRVFAARLLKGLGIKTESGQILFP